MAFWAFSKFSRVFKHVLGFSRFSIIVVLSLVVLPCFCLMGFSLMRHCSVVQDQKAVQVECQQAVELGPASLRRYSLRASTIWTWSTLKRAC